MCTFPTINPRELCYAIREMKRKGCYVSHVNAAAARFALASGLLHESHWPAYTVSITDAGYQYLIDNEENSDD